MALEPIEVDAQWSARDGFLPRRIHWHDGDLTVMSVGRHWEDDAGWHVLCQVDGMTVLELIFRLQPAGWQIRTPVGGSQLA